ncbi:hypothetical protein [Mucilaginibacter polytrichastri]|uniref:Uncharacterized protein n=1 Tax=Mucilaginibacter polytrichastri TaxID=1302689 RepID=A0A1Q6A0H0_9SPHI|nr:hypothetical protein [Mucilaginibacter polytrichastri]OKS87507.1 hypothetical protein RG47T_2968 [Mucilaginibacter polytrichastri]SFS91502.1 hypothetical protein SAMN04487890_106102 [Mucilaginibacter polytrichastri]
MEKSTCTKDIAEATNRLFEQEMSVFLRAWVQNHGDQTLLQFDQTLEEYLENDALRDFFVNIQHPIQHLLKNDFIACHLGRCAKSVYFDPVNGDPFLARAEQRIYNLGRRMDSERMHVPFRTVQPNKQTDTGDTAEVSSYPPESEEIRYNSGNHFISRPANDNVFDENSKRCVAKSDENLHILFKRGFLEDRLQDVKDIAAAVFGAGERQPQFFVIYSRHSLKEGHFGVSLVIVDPAKPEYPKRVLVCDTLLKELPQHPRWWHHFIAEYSNVFGDGIVEIIEDLSHPLQKVNIKGDEPYRHDWDCPYYAASMADALANLVKSNPDLLLNGCVNDIHQAMKELMPDYYLPDCEVKDRADIRQTNQLKRWESGRNLIHDLLAEMSRESSYKV